MRAVHVVEIETPKGVLLHGLWFGPKRAEKVIVWVHGLSSSVFSRHDQFEALVSRDTAVLVFNNRGHDKVARVAKRSGKRLRGGAAHEIFTDCIDDIDGAIRCARKHGAKNIFLAGHSTGCQKSVYWAYKRGRGVRGIILLAPISDYAGAHKSFGESRVRKAVSYAKRMIRDGKKHELIPERMWTWDMLADAQRFVSLYSGNGAEETFPYWNSKRVPKVFRSIEIPMLVMLAENDEFADRSAKELDLWFTNHLYTGEVRIVEGSDHGFKGHERAVAILIDGFMKERYN